MGIENFFNIIKKNFFTEKINKEERIYCDYLYIDFNSIIYTVSNTLENDINYYLYSLIINQIDDESKDISEKYDFKITNIDEFKKYFNSDRLSELFKHNVFKYLDNIINNIVDNTNIKSIYISIDGTPTLSKIIEQRKRRYINYMVDIMKKNIYEKFKNTVDEHKKTYYDNEIIICKIITQWSIYIQEIYNNLNSPEYFNQIKQICKNLNNIIISSSYEFGEGEKKIMENILHYNNSGSYVIFTPDSDVMLLSLLMKNKFDKQNIQNKFNIIKHNEYNDEIEVISICNLKENILIYIFERMNNFRKINHNKNNIIDDIIGLFSFFGNDFLPKIESINTKNNINIIIDTYIKYLNWCRNNNIYLLYEENNITKINYDALINIIDKLAEYEDKIIFDKYLSNEYKNYNYLTEIFGNNSITPFFIDKLNRYCHGFNKIIRYIKLNCDIKSNDVINNIINNFTDKEQFINQFIKIEGCYNYDENENMNDKIKFIESIIDKIIDKIKNKENVKCGLKLVKYSNLIDDKYHQKCLKEELIHPNMMINDYDKEIYKLDKRMDSYKNIGLDDFNNIGITELKYKNSEYKIYTDKHIDNKKKIYYEKIMNLYSKQSIDYICKEYIRGLFWTIDFYFNKNNRQININNISIWYYKYDHSPYFKEIYDFLYNIKNGNNELNKLFYSINDIKNSSYVRASQFMNKFEQYLYITPKSINFVPDIYKPSLLETNLFIDIDTLIEKILNGNNELLDMYNIKYMNKGNIIGLKNFNFTEFMEKMYKLRQYIDMDKLLNIDL